MTTDSLLLQKVAFKPSRCGCAGYTVYTIRKRIKSMGFKSPKYKNSILERPN